MIYNVVLISAVQQSDLYIYIYTHILFIFFSSMVYHRILNIVPCAVQWELVVYSGHTFIFYFNLIRVQLIYNAELVSVVQPSDSVMHPHEFILC